MDFMEKNYSAGFTIPELIVTIIVFSIVSVSAYTLLLAHINASSVVKLRTAALSLATEQIEYLRSLPYDSLAVAGGSIVSSATPIPTPTTQTRAGREFDVVTDIRYADDAFDGCLNYGASQEKLCRNYKTGTTLTDTNPRDYKVADVTIRDKKTGKEYARLSSQFTSRVAETAGNTSAMLVTVIDSAGSPVAGATVTIQNSTLSPAVSQSITTDGDGTALFLDVRPDTGDDYVVSASKTGFSSLSTIPVNGALTPKHPNVTALVQQVSNVTLTIDRISTDSLLVQTIDATGAAVGNVSFAIRGGIKLYTDPEDTSYSYQQVLTTDASGQLHVPSLVPGSYEVCYLSDGQCASTSTRRMSALRAAYGESSYQPFIIPAGVSSLIDGGPMQRIVIVTTTSSASPRITLATPAAASSSATDAGATIIQIYGANLSGSSVLLHKDGQTITGAVPADPDMSDQLGRIWREFNLSGVGTGAYDLVVDNGAGQVTQSIVAPGSLGGVNVAP